MSVLACSRNNCGNVMCDRYSYKYGYLCSSCFEELVKTKPMNGSEIEAFMLSPKQEQEPEPEEFDRYAYCDYEFPI
jgi:hypothetical protein